MAEDEPKKQKCKAGAPLWMCTFADMMSLLLCFFVLILSFASLDEPAFNKATGSLKDAFGLQREIRVLDPSGSPEMITRDFPSIPLSLEVDVKEIFAEELSAGLVEVDQEDAQSLTVRVKDSLAYESGKAEIKDNFKPLLDKLGKVAVELDAGIIVSGHTDNVVLKKTSPFKTNWELSAARAVEVVEFWSQKYKIPPKRLSAAGYADGVPLATNNTAEGRAQNRRVEFKIRPNKTWQAFKGIKELTE